MAFLMGVDTQDCRRVAQLIGYKTFTNEFVAYIEMGKLLDNGKVYSNYTATFGPDAPIEHNGLDVTLTQWGTVLIGGFLTVSNWDRTWELHVQLETFLTIPCHQFSHSLP